MNCKFCNKKMTPSNGKKRKIYCNQKCCYQHHKSIGDHLYDKGVYNKNYPSKYNLKPLITRYCLKCDKKFSSRGDRLCVSCHHSNRGCLDVESVSITPSRSSRSNS